MQGEKESMIERSWLGRDWKIETLKIHSSESGGTKASDDNVARTVYQDQGDERDLTTQRAFS